MIKKIVLVVMCLLLVGCSIDNSEHVAINKNIEIVVQNQGGNENG